MAIDPRALEDLVEALDATRRGDFSVRLSKRRKGVLGDVAAAYNELAATNERMTRELVRIARIIGREGRMTERASLPGAAGDWKTSVDSINSLIDDLVRPTTEVGRVLMAVADGDLSQKMALTIEGQPVKGEFLSIGTTVNTMVDQLSSFADEVTRVAREVGTEGKLGGQAEVEGVSGTWRGLTENVNQLAGNLTTQVRAIAEVSTAVTQGDLTRSIAVEAQGEVAELKDNINEMIANLRDTTKQNAESDWLKTNLAQISGLMQGQRDLTTVSALIMSELTPTVSAQHGAFFLLESIGADPGESELRLIASYGYRPRKGVPKTFRSGEGLVGQAAVEKKSILVTEPPGNYIRVVSGLGESAPANIIVLPVVFEERVLAVIELASFQKFSDIDLQFLEQLTETIGVTVNTIIANTRTEELLEQSQSLTQELQSQSEELKTRAGLLGQQNRDIEVKNREIEIARRNLEEKAEQLALSSKYKSEFLANMSHELRTPLNSLLILSKLLTDNEEGHLSERQVEYAGTIHGAGSDLLSLINDILDLSKVEAGKMEVRPAPLALVAVQEYVERGFRPVAEAKNLGFSIELGEGLPAAITTDEQRLQQVLKNLLSNAFKFTEQGGVTLRIAAADDQRISFSVADTGMGIQRDKLKIIFEAFQQGEGGTSRRHGGTGLGLSISREMALLLGGELEVSSNAGEGSEFTLHLPLEYVPVDEPVATAPLEPAEPAIVLTGNIPEGTGGNGDAPAGPTRAAELDWSLLEPGEVDDDRAAVVPGDRVVLVVSPDADHASAAVAAIRARGSRALAALRDEAGLALAHEFIPDAIVLTVEGAEDGARALEHLKRHPETRHIPVYAEAEAGRRQPLLAAGAAGHLEAPATTEALDGALGELERLVERRSRRLLVVEDDEVQRSAIVELIGASEALTITAVGSGEEALTELEEEPFDCVVLDLTLPQMGGFALLEKIRSDSRLRDLPVIVYTGKELTQREEGKLRQYTESIIVKDASSPERLLDQTSLYLHRPEARLPAEQRRMLERLRNSDAVFQGKRILLVDDDVRNVFALASALETRGMDILFAENGKDGIETLRANPDVDLVLMDIMMPEMDGYEATRRMRGMDEFKQLPIVALTAKAMKGDREKSLAAGASDYIAKPVDTDRLLTLMRVWLHG